MGFALAARLGFGSQQHLGEVAEVPGFPSAQLLPAHLLMSSVMSLSGWLLWWGIKMKVVLEARRLLQACDRVPDCCCSGSEARLSSLWHWHQKGVVMPPVLAKDCGFLSGGGISRTSGGDGQELPTSRGPRPDFGDLIR